MRHILFVAPLLGSALLYSQQPPAPYACEAPAGIQAVINQAGQTWDGAPPREVSRRLLGPARLH